MLTSDFSKELLRPIWGLWDRAWSAVPNFGLPTKWKTLPYCSKCGRRLLRWHRAGAVHGLQGNAGNCLVQPLESCSCCPAPLMGKESELDSSQRCTWKGWEATGTGCSMEMLIRPKEIPFHQEGGQALEHIAQVGCETSVLADNQNSREQTCTGPALSERLDQTSPRGPFQLKLLYDSVKSSKYYVSQSLCFKKTKRKFLLHTPEVKYLPFRPTVLDRCCTEWLVWGQREVKEASLGCWILETFEFWRIKGDKN